MEPDEIARLIDKAAKAQDSNDALKFSQAALNVAHAQQVRQERLERNQLRSSISSRKTLA